MSDKVCQFCKRPATTAADGCTLRFHLNEAGGSEDWRDYDDCLRATAALAAAAERERERLLMAVLQVCDEHDLPQPDEAPVRFDRVNYGYGRADTARAVRSATSPGRCTATCPHGDRCRLPRNPPHEFHNHTCECNEPDVSTKEPT